MDYIEPCMNLGLSIRINPAVNFSRSNPPEGRSASILQASRHTGRQNNLPVQPDSQLDAAARGSYPRLSGGMLAPLMEQTEDEEDESGGERSLYPLPAQERSDDHVLHYLLTNASWLVCSTMMSGPTCTTLPRFNLPIRALTVVC